MVQDLGLKWIVGPSAFAAGLGAGALDVELNFESQDTAPPSRNTGDSAAYVIFTSGSTGLPKGVVVPHRAIARLVLNTDYAPLTPDDVVGHASNPSFDAATFEIWGPLLNGGRLVVIPRQTMLDPTRLGGLIRDERITALFITTALFNQIATIAPDTFRPLRCLMFGGDAASPQSVARVWESGAPARLLNMYGPTEVTTFSTAHFIAEHPRNHAIPIGRPIANTEAYVLDSALQPVPIGVAGELFLGGDGLAICYHAQPELTDAKFVPDPFHAGRRLYRTGDLVRLREDGAIVFLGRLDGQIKLRGFRVELGEIEAELSKHPQVSEVAVKVCGTEADEKSLAAYFIARPGAIPSEASLRELLAARLPDYMIPSVFVAMERLPLNANGKIDRKALPTPISSQPSTSAASGNSTEVRVAAVMASVLRVANVPLDADFFRLGGHSLLAMELLAQLKAEFGIKIPTARIFETATARGLAYFIQERSIRPPTLDSRFIVPIQRGAPGVPPLFLVAGGWGGDIEFLVYGQFGRSLGEDQPIYGLKARGAGTAELPHSHVAEMAADYLREIRAVQPHGPYFLAGECVGGICAHEIACQLREAGEAVVLGSLKPA